jgi:tetratricopeptide (TPR) repeat protein
VSVRNIFRLLSLLVLVVSMQGPILKGQSAAVPWDKAKNAGLELRQVLVIGDYRLAVQYAVWIADLVQGSPGAEHIAENVRTGLKRAQMTGDLEPALTAAIVPTADKLLEAIDRNDAAAVPTLTTQILIQLRQVYKEARSNRSEWLSAYLMLTDNLDVALRMNDLAKAVTRAADLQRMIEDMKSKHEDVGYYARNIYDINDALGRAAFARGDLKAAREYLLKAADIPPGTPGADTLCCAGPNLWLAKSLLGVGERDVVLKFLEACKQFWTQSADHRLDQWIAAIRNGESPDLLPNAAVGM